MLARVRVRVSRALGTLTLIVWATLTLANIIARRLGRYVHKKNWKSIKFKFVNKEALGRGMLGLTLGDWR